MFSVDAATDANWHRGGTQWMREHYEVPVVIGVAYLVGIFALQRRMRSSAAFDIKFALAAWNALLAVFSMAGVYFLLPAYAASVAKSGLFGSRGELCHRAAEHATPWVFFFILSKIPELLDTVFIVLRKRPLRLLQYYHHVMTMGYCWHAWAIQATCGGAFALMNLIVHSFMYSYFSLAALGVRFSQPIRMSITILQISQMVFGTFFVAHTWFACPGDAESVVNLKVAGFMYLSYFVLFVKLFVDSYFKKRKPSAAKKSPHQIRAKKVD